MRKIITKVKKVSQVSMDHRVRLDHMVNQGQEDQLVMMEQEVFQDKKVWKFNRN